MGDLANLTVVALIGFSIALLVAVVRGIATERERDERVRRLLEQHSQSRRTLEQLRETMSRILETQASQEELLAESVGDPAGSPAPILGEASVQRAVRGSGPGVRRCLETIVEVLERHPIASPAQAAARRAVLGHALTLSAGPAPGRESGTELVWKLELFGEELARLGADGGPAWKRLCDATAEMSRELYGQDFEIFLPGSGEPVHEEFHEVDGAGGPTIARALRWGINDTARGRNLLRARVEAC